MGVYIPDIDIPAPGEVFYFVQDRETGKVLIQVGSTDKELKVVPIPPHGRLGDLDALANRVEYERFHHTHTDGLAARHHVAEYGHFLKVISYAPTIIHAEEGE